MEVQRIQTLKNEKAVSLIKTCAKFSGVQDLANDDYLVISSMLKNQFGHWSLTDIGKAFEVYASGKLGSIEHYGIFSPKFFGQVLQAYREWKAKETKKQKPIEVEKQIPMKQKSKEEIQLEAYEFVKDCYEKGEEIYTANWSDCYLYMEKNGIIKLSKEQKIKIFEQVKKEINSEITKRRGEYRSFADLISTLASPKSLELLCRKKVVIEYFEG